MASPLSGIRVIDLGINAPGPFASMMLANLGAEVVSIVNPAVTGGPDYAGAGSDPMLAARGGPADALQRGKTTRAIDLKSEAGRDEMLSLVDAADIVISEMRPGKLEALGLGYDELSKRNQRLILCEISGYGKDHPQAARAGHDINYMAQSGALSLIRDRQGRPVVPQNIIGDYAAGGSLSVNAILAALYEREKTGVGRQISLSMTAGIHYLMTDIAAATLLAGHPSDSWRPTLNGGMPTYNVYETADGLWMAVGALEPKFITILGEAMEWPELVDLMNDVGNWETVRSGLEVRFKTRCRDEWAALFVDLDACVSAVLSLDELAGDGLTKLFQVYSWESE
ncbi:MAG: CoA transferase [Gammaproteobacteria bacterium]|nr:CoA transferase [Gammaproteobacteria bacterium]